MSTIRFPNYPLSKTPNNITKNVSLNYRPCTCSIDSTSSNTTTSNLVGPLRAWVVGKDCSSVFGSTGLNSRRAWFTTLARNDKDVGELESEEKVRVQQRRQRSNSSSNSGGMLIGSPDLLTIPGVGPSNLRKWLIRGSRELLSLKNFIKTSFMESRVRRWWSSYRVRLVLYIKTMLKV